MRRFSRRQFLMRSGAASLAGAGLLAGCGRLPWQAEQAPKSARVGLLLGAVSSSSPEADSFRQGLREHGYVEGQNITIEARSAQGNMESMVALAAELVNLPADIIVTAGLRPAQIAMEATRTIPIVIAAIPTNDPVAEGLVCSLARPCGNVTGLSGLATPLAGKRMELLKQTIPGMIDLAVVWSQDYNSALMLREIQDAAHTLDVRLHMIHVTTPDELPTIFESAQHHRADALLIPTSGIILAHRQRFTEVLTRASLPTMTDRSDLVQGGVLMSYGASITASYRRAAYYVDRILKGAKPADLPVEQPMIFDFAVNMKTARALGITFPHEVALQITEVIE